MEAKLPRTDADGLLLEFRNVLLEHVQPHLRRERVRRRAGRGLRTWPRSDSEYAPSCDTLPELLAAVDQQRREAEYVFPGEVAESGRRHVLEVISFDWIVEPTTPAA